MLSILYIFFENGWLPFLSNFLVDTVEGTWIYSTTSS